MTTPAKVKSNLAPTFFAPHERDELSTFLNDPGDRYWVVEDGAGTVIACSSYWVVHEDKRYMGHANISPALPEILTFCQEGPWALTDQRIWGLNIQTGETWKVRPQEGDPSVDRARVLVRRRRAHWLPRPVACGGWRARLWPLQVG